MRGGREARGCQVECKGETSQRGKWHINLRAQISLWLSTKKTGDFDTKGLICTFNSLVFILSAPIESKRNCVI